MAYDFNSLTKQADEAINRDKFYTDFEDVDPNVLHQISELTEWIRTKGKGSDVREVIAQLFERTWIEGTKEGNANLEVAKARGEFKTLSERLNDLLSRMSSIASGSPKGAYLNLEALKSALPNGGEGIYVTADNGHWYYYNNGWKDGGIYQAMNTELDFDSFSEEMLELFNFDVRLVDIEIVLNSYFSHPTGQIVANNNTSRTNMIPVTKDEIYIVSGTSYFDARVATFVDGDGRVIKSYPSTSEHTKFNTIIKVPDGAVGLYLNTEKGKEMFLLKLVNIYGRLGELAHKIAETSNNNWEKVELTVNKVGAYYSILKILPETPDTQATSYKAIPVQPGETYKVEGSNYWNGRLWITLDKMGRVSRYFGKDDQSAHTDTITIQDGESLLFINSQSSNPAKLYKAVVGMPKKTITAIGDSWTDASTLAGKDNWVDYCIELFSSKYNIDLDVKNLGIGGTGFLNSNGTHGNYSERDIPADSDLYIVFGSFNDAFVEFDFGDVETHQKGTLYGAMHDVVTKIYSKNINAKILFITPGPWGSINPQRPLQAGPRENAAAFAEDYVNAMIKFGKYNSIPVLDFYHSSNLMPWNDNFINQFYHGTSPTDTTHPNSAGHKRITPQIADFIFKEF